MPGTSLTAIPENFRGAARRLDLIDIPTIAREIDTGEDELRALIEVESRGHGFDNAGRPVMLFEPHIFWAELGKGEKRDRAVREGLAYPRWGEKPYPRDSYPRLKAAMQIDRDAALRAASWGLPQILGRNHAAAGFGSAEEMVATFCADEEHHIRALVNFLVANKLDDDLRAHRWTDLARGYNGAGYAKHGYHTRLAAAFERWRQKPDVDLRTAAQTEAALGHKSTEEARVAEHGTDFASRAKVKAVQERLAALGYHMVGRPDGVAGPRTAGAIAAFQKENGLDITGEITPALIDQLEHAEPLEVSPERAEGEPKDSRIVEGGSAITKVGGALVGAGGIKTGADLLDKAEEARGYVERIKALIEPVRELIADYWPVLAIAGGAWLAWRGVAIVRARIEDHRTGKTA